MLKIEHLNLSFGGLKATNDICMHVKPNQITALIGPNGAGKTTLFNQITGVYKPDSGQIWFNGVRIDEKKPYQINGAGISRTYQVINLFRKMSVLENVQVGMHTRLKSNYWKNLIHTKSMRIEETASLERAYELLDFVGLTEHAKDQAGSLSYGSHDGNTYWLSELDHDTAKFLRKHFSFCVPVPVLDRHSTFGVGDRLGLAGEGHLRVFKEYQMMPVLAQQSVREMALTHRTMDDVIDSATFSVFREGYRGGFGADGDHLKHLEEVREAIAHGYTMITLDCSDHIDNEAAILTDEEISARCEVDPELRERYLTHSFAVLIRF